MEVLTRAQARIGSGRNSAIAWAARAAEAGVSLDEFYQVAEQLNARKVIGRFSTFLEHVKPSDRWSAGHAIQRAFSLGGAAGSRNRSGRRGRAGITSSRIATGARADRNSRMSTSWPLRTERTKRLLLAHKAAIDGISQTSGIPVSYTNVFWGGRSEIKPSEISPQVYQAMVGGADEELKTLQRHKGYNGFGLFVKLKTFSVAAIQICAKGRWQSSDDQLAGLARSPAKLPGTAALWENLPTSDSH